MSKQAYIPNAMSLQIEVNEMFEDVYNNKINVIKKDMKKLMNTVEKKTQIILEL